MGRFYREELRLPLSWWERRSLFSLWHFFNITSDVFIIFGTIYKILLELDVSKGGRDRERERWRERGMEGEKKGKGRGRESERGRGGKKGGRN